MRTWEEAAFIKLARLGAIVLLPTEGGKYLLQDEGDHIRPPGGHRETTDKNLTRTIIRELGEEFALQRKHIKHKLQFLGYEYRKPYEGNAVFMLVNHGLKPGEYQASNSPDEKVVLVEAKLTDSRYTGPVPDKLLTESCFDDPAKQARYITEAELKRMGEEAREKGVRLVRVHMFQPKTEKTRTITTGIGGSHHPDETPEDAGIRTTELFWGVKVDETAIERMPKADDGDYQVRVLVSAEGDLHHKKASVDSDEITATLPIVRAFLAKLERRDRMEGHGKWYGSCGHVLYQCRCKQDDEHKTKVYRTKDRCKHCWEHWQKKKADFAPGYEDHGHFQPDFTPDEIEEKSQAQDRLYNKVKPRLASMAIWPKHWVNNDDTRGWVEWYSAYHGGRRNPDDDRQIKRWKSFKARHGSQFAKRPTPRRAWALVNWGIDPVKMLPEQDRSAFEAEMHRYRDTIDSSVKKADVDEDDEILEEICRLFPDDSFVKAAENIPIAWEPYNRAGQGDDITDPLSEDPEAKPVDPNQQPQYFDSSTQPPPNSADPNAEKQVGGGGFFTEGEVRERCRQECINATGNPNPTEEELQAFATEYLNRKAQEQDDGTDYVNKTGSINYKERLRRLRIRRGEHPDTGKVLSEEELEQWMKMEPKAAAASPLLSQSTRTAPGLSNQAQKRAGATGHEESNAGHASSSLGTVDRRVPKDQRELEKPGSSRRVERGFYDSDPKEASAKAEPPGLSGHPDTHEEATSDIPLPYRGHRPDAGGWQRLPPGTAQTIATGGDPALRPEAAPGGPQPAADTRAQQGLLDPGRSDANALPEHPVTGPEAIHFALQNLDLGKLEADARSVVARKLKSKRPDAVKVLGYLEGMRRMGISPHELMLSRVPVIPPVFRPYSVTGDTFVPGDANELYRDLMNLLNVHQELEGKLGPQGARFNHLNIYDGMGALYGYREPTSPKTRERGISGFLKKVTGTNPKFSFFQHKMLAKDMDYVGRSVIGVDPELGLDEIGVPEDVLWKLYSPYLQRNLVRAGMTAEEALKSIRDKTDPAKRALHTELKSRPVVYSRAPSWHKFNVIAGYPKIAEGNMIRINPLVTTGMNADFDGDTLNIHLPSMPSAVHDAKEKLMPSKMLFSVKDRNKTMPVPKQEFVLGLYQAQKRPARATYSFPDMNSALAAIRRGQVSLSDEIQIGAPQMV